MSSHTSTIKPAASPPNPAPDPGAAAQSLLPRPVLIALLLAANGFLLALTLILSRTAQGMGLSPVTYGFWMSVGAALLLSLHAGRHLADLRQPKMARYAGLSGLLSLAAPQLLMFTVLTHIGAGLASIVYALPVLLTYLFARALGLEGRDGVRMTGAIVGTLGATLLLMPTDGGLPLDVLPWMALALLVPLILASGNIYRAVAWPEGARPSVLAAGCVAISVAFFGVASAPFGADLNMFAVEGVWPFVLVQAFVSAGQFLAYFALQRVAPPVIFSLIGQLALAFGLPMGAIFLGESYTPVTFLAVGLMAVGLVGVVGGPILKARRTGRL
ncbi:DMT family transporter [Kordiimonas aestuarii]|uniref:DMT family transporter n=1 Tax=Kordiimonas aestuarii TaxID=1005925 RepID=UPI0021D0D7B0|nr:DMT family transporter [Kordiimonas aestuarii]